LGGREEKRKKVQKNANNPTDRNSVTSVLRTFVSLTPLLQGLTFIAARAGPVGQGA